MDERIKIAPKKKIAFVCSGGATKAGAFHLGVALGLQERGFRFAGGLQTPGVPPRPSEPMEISTFVGSSAGSVISAYLAAGYSLENIFNSFIGRKPTDPRDAIPKILPKLTYPTMLKMRPGLAREQLAQLGLLKTIAAGIIKGNFEAILQLRWIKATGLFTTAGVEQFLREEVLPSNRFADYASDLFVIATQLNHSRKVVFGKYSYSPPAHDLNCQYNNDVSISEACAASSSLPFIYTPYSIQHGGSEDETHYVDGEIRDTLSTHVAMDAGCDLVFASYTHQPYHWQKEIGSLTKHGLPAILIQSIYLVIEQKVNQYIYQKESQRSAILAVEKYCQQVGLPEEHLKRILGILEAELHHRKDVDTIYIHPNPADAQMFFGEHFSLSPKKLADLVRSGFRAATETLKRYEFADRVVGPKVVSAKG
ncbi:MAG: patatin-like phospholipase family protein [Bdellovibrionales bacterium]|nr:patatin-like phospholipase family protein [Bdellovibrionales bacterium]